MALTSPKFGYGDQVVVSTNGTNKSGKVISVFRDRTGSIQCRVRFDSPTVVPSEMEFPESLLSPSGKAHVGLGRWVDIDVGCPKCGSSWHTIEHPVFGKKQIWYDCIKCDKTREQIEKEQNSK